MTIFWLNVVLSMHFLGRVTFLLYSFFFDMPLSTTKSELVHRLRVLNKLTNSQTVSNGDIILFLNLYDPQKRLNPSATLTRKTTRSRVVKVALPDPAVIWGPRRLPTLYSPAVKQVFLQNGSSITTLFLFLFNRLGVLQKPKSNIFRGAPSKVILTLRRPLQHGTKL